MNQLPNPLTAAECDLRDFAFMPLDVVRLRDSDIAALSTAEEFRAAVLLWCASWHQVPAASLPDDDRVLAQLAGYGRVVTEWRKVRTGALRGWVTCADGRLYHPVVAEKARDAWAAKHEQRYKTECARIKKHNQRHGTDIEFPTFEEFLSPDYRDPVPRDKRKVSPATTGKRPPGQTGVVPTTVPRETASKGQGEGEVNLKASGGGTAQAVGDDAPIAAAAFVEILRSSGVGFAADDARLASWPVRGVTVDDLRAAVATGRKRRERERSEQPLNVGFLDTILGDLLAARAATPATGTCTVGDWWRSWTGIVDHGGTLGVEQGRDEPPFDFKLRVFEAAGDGPWWDDHNRAFRNTAGPVAAGALMGEGR
ncbi:DUF1376 domain-containing protein [Burkholderia cepacia]|uniref:DUF1376 domain-containing protein n=1 Tax=Burkholderia cepacia TaxID=292 RepID=UPI00234969AA|nr:DUF1376 domain-containing protein [Burkholderia cepacia]MDC6101743.1 DUF1376 domain-containing protein [Burkholderia cepacia]